MNKIYALLAAVTVVIGISSPCRGVTPEELEQARTYAAIVYLRNANNGADYLDNVSAGSRKALEGKLKDADKANLKLFNSKLPSASGSERWGMDELVEYAQQAVVAPGNYSSTGFARNQVSKRVRGMKLSAPKPVAPSQSSAQTEQPVETQAQPAPQPEETVTPEPEQEVNLPDPFATEEPAEAAGENALVAAEDSLMNSVAEEPQPAQSSGSSAIYIVILCVLVVLVVALVIYAARYFKKQNGEAAPRSVSGADTAGAAYASRDTVARDIEADDRDRTIESLRTENAELRRAIEEYKYHINYLKQEKEKNEQRVIQDEARAAAAPATLNDAFSRRHERAAASVRAESEEPANVYNESPAADRRQRVIYLGRSNREGMFIRAERNLNPQHSLFRMVTTDNITGSYSIAEDAEVEDRIMSNPELMLAVSCRVEDGAATDYDSVATIQPGTAIFENGRWRVLRPAVVKFV